MDARPESAAEEAARLRRCLNDLVSLMALPALWASGDPVRIVETMLEALQGMLGASFTFARLNQPLGASPRETLHASDAWPGPRRAAALGVLLQSALGDAWASRPPGAVIRLEGEQVWLTSVSLGFQGELGVVVAGSTRVGFPEPTERLVLEVAANQAALALQQARLLDEQTAERRRAEAAVLDTEREALLIVDTIPGLVALLAPTGGVDVANAQLLEYFGQTLEELRQWGSNGTVHPDDLTHVAEIFTRSVAAGEPYEILQRLRRRDGVYRWMQNRGFPLRARTGQIARWCVLLTDVDEQKQTEVALREREREARLIVDSIPGLVVVLNQAGEVEFVSGRTVEYLGLELAAAQGWAINGIVSPDDIPRVLPIFQAGVTSGEPFDYEVRLRHVDGAYRWFQLRARPLRDSAGRIGRWYVLLSDIDGLKRAEAAQLESERELRQIVDTIPGLVVILAESGAVAFENRRTREYLGPDLADTGGWAANGIVHPDDLPRVMPVFASGIASGEPFEYEVRLRHVTAMYRWFLLRAHPLRDMGGQVARWYVLLSDIDDRRRTEEELRRSEVFLAEGQRISQTGTFSWRVETDDLTFSEELKRIFEFDRQTPVTFERITDRVHPADLPMLAERMADVRAGRDNPEYEIRLQMPDLRVKYARVFGRVFRHDDGGLECVGAVQDVTRRRLAEDSRDAMRAALAQATRAMSLSTLTASIAHEVNQPLSGIITNASACLRMLGTEPPDLDGARDTARRTIRDGNRAADIVTRLRGLFGNRQLAPEVLDINDAAREVVELSLVDFQRNDVVLQTELDETLPAVTGDRVQLQQVLFNLLRNASDAMVGIDDRVRQIVIRTGRDADGGVCVTVRDAGPGVDPQHLDRLFDPFYTTKDHGMGIGLSVSRSIIENHNGRLWAEQNPGHGAAFSFSIPLHAETFSEQFLPTEGRS